MTAVAITSGMIWRGSNSLPVHTGFMTALPTPRIATCGWLMERQGRAATGDDNIASGGGNDQVSSGSGVDTTGSPAERYSGVFVGLMNFVDSFIAKGISATSHPLRYAGSWP